MDCCALYVGSVYVCDSPIVNGYGVEYGVGYGGEQVAGHVGRCLGNTQNLTVEVAYPSRTTFRRGIPYKENLHDPEFVSINFSVNCNSKRNMQEAFAGLYNQVFINEVSVTDQPVAPITSFAVGDFVAFEHPAVDLSTLVVKRSDTLAVLVDGQDYFKTRAGIKMNVGFNSGTDLLISYDYSNQSYDELQTYLHVPIPRGIFFTGQNVSTGEYITLTFGHVEFQPIAQMEYLGGEFVTMNITANIVPIEYTGTGLSDYFVERRFT